MYVYLYVYMYMCIYIYIYVCVTFDGAPWAPWAAAGASMHRDAACRVRAQNDISS